MGSKLPTPVFLQKKHKLNRDKQMMLETRLFSSSIILKTLSIVIGTVCVTLGIEVNLPAYGGLIVRSVDFQPSSISIPKDGFITPQTFTVDVEVKNDWDVSMSIASFNFSLLELDTAGNHDIVIANTPVVLAPPSLYLPWDIAPITPLAPFPITVTANQLNSTCDLADCDTFLGRRAELSSLEFAIIGSINSFHVNDPTSITTVPFNSDISLPNRSISEPYSTLSFLVLGIIGARSKILNINASQETD